MIADRATVAEMQMPSNKPKISCRRFAERYRFIGTSSPVTSTFREMGNRVLETPATSAPDESLACWGRAFATNFATASGSPAPTLAGVSVATGQDENSSSGASCEEGRDIHSRICSRASSERRRNLSPPDFFAALVQTSSPHASIRSRRLSENQRCTGPF